MPCGPEFSSEFSAPPQFSVGVPEKDLCTGWTPTSNLMINNQILYQWATVSLKIISILILYFQHGVHGLFLLAVAGTYILMQLFLLLLVLLLLASIILP
jgi:hypothetical protein